MEKEKQYVFSARTTEDGLEALGEVKARLKLSWDELVIGAVSAHYGLDKAMMTLPRKENPAKEVPAAEQQAPEETAAEHPAEEKPRPKKQRAKGKKKGTKGQEAGQ